MRRGAGEVALQSGALVDLWLVLLAFLVTTASFAPQRCLSVREAGSDCENPELERTPVVVLLRVDQLRVMDDGVTRVRVDHQRDARGRLQVSTFMAELAVLKQSHQALDVLKISAEDDVVYDDLIRVIDSVKPLFSTVVVSPAAGG